MILLKRSAIGWTTLCMFLAITIVFAGKNSTPSGSPGQTSLAAYESKPNVIDSGGGKATSSSYVHFASIGQVAIGPATSSSFQNEAGFFTPEAVSERDRGDCNGDGEIDLLDILTAVNHILGTSLLVGDDLWAADCNGDGEIDLLDLISIVNVILGIGECVPGHCRTEITPETLELLKSLEPYLPTEDFSEIMTMVKEVQVPIEYSLSQNYPNPFNPLTTIEYSLPEAARVRVEIYNTLGQIVEVLVHDLQEAGYYAITWDAGKMPSGVYFYRIAANGFTATRRMVLMK
ncbi:MAG: T9SS type A sorting domain-containing protein [Gemmatimonadota bacterium]|nr:MAG: T9SS type A sorting domain-containing protein [Gemmatimonadota bacterium]